MRKTVFVLAGLVSAASLTLVGCDVRKTQDGNVDVPKYEVSKTKDGDVTLPKYDVTAPKVDVTTEKKDITVPKLEVHKDAATVTVPKVDITPADQVARQEGKPTDDKKKH